MVQQGYQKTSKANKKTHAGANATLRTKPTPPELNLL